MAASVYEDAIIGIISAPVGFLGYVNDVHGRLLDEKMVIRRSYSNSIPKWFCVLHATKDSSLVTFNQEGLISSYQHLTGPFFFLSRIIPSAYQRATESGEPSKGFPLNSSLEHGEDADGDREVETGSRICDTEDIGRNEDEEPRTTYILHTFYHCEDLLSGVVEALHVVDYCSRVIIEVAGPGVLPPPLSI